MQRDAHLNNAALMARRRAALPTGLGQTYDIVCERAENAEMWDVEGKRYIDFAGGIAVLNTGHRHPKIVAAVKAQLDKVHHTCFQVLAYEPYIDLAERLIAKAPGDFAKKAFFLTTGAEAVENAVKIARSATKRSAIIAFGGGFHGRTLLGMGLTGKVAPYKAGFGPFPAEIYHAKYPNELHGVVRSRRPRLHRGHLQVRRRGRTRRRADHRAGAGRRRLLRHHARVRAGAARAVRQARHRLHRRRSADRRRPHRYVAGQRAVGRRARHDHDGQVDGRRLPDLGRHRQGRADGRPRPRRPGRHLRRLAAGVRRGRWPCWTCSTRRTCWSARSPSARA